MLMTYEPRQQWIRGRGDDIDPEPEAQVTLPDAAHVQIDTLRLAVVRPGVQVYHHINQANEICKGK